MKRKYNGEDLPDLDLSPKQQQSNLQVVVRCRPIIERDLTNNNAECVKVLDEQTLLVTEPYDLDGHSQGEKARKMQFEFERVFDKSATQQEIYRHAFLPLLPGLFEGVNATVFCYGASQAGKTFTIQGQADTPGLLQLGIHDISELLERPENVNSVLKFSYVEIYNEVIKDLLASDDKVLDIREDPVKGVVLSGVSEIITSNKKELITMIKVGNKNRSEENRHLDAGRRSHNIVIMQIEKFIKGPNNETSMYVSKFFVADLAGTEKTLGVKGKKVKEGGNVNRSLLALGNCINSLSEGRGKGFVPYRDSKLTRLLKDSLGGNSRTLMITNISTSTRDYEETLNSLKYSIRAKSIKNTALKNKNSAQDSTEEFATIIESLKKENEKLKKILQEEGTAKTPKPPSKNSIDSQKSNTLLDLEQRIRLHFGKERELRQLKVDIEEQIMQLEDEMGSNPHSNNDSNHIKINQLTNRKAKVNEELSAVQHGRNKLNDEINYNGLNNIQMNFLSNIMYREKLELDLLEGRPEDKKSEKVQSYNDWNLEFLKQQVLMRDKIMTDQIDVLNDHGLNPVFSYEGLRKVENLASDVRRNDDLFLPPLFQERKQMKGGISVSKEGLAKGGMYSNKLGPMAKKTNFESLANLRPPQSTSKLSQFEEIRNKYYKRYIATSNPQNARLQGSAHSRSSNSREASQERLRVESPSYASSKNSDAFGGLRIRANPNAKSQGYLQKFRLNNPAVQKYHHNVNQSPYVQNFKKSTHESMDRQSKIGPVFSVDALESKKRALERLNEKLKNLN